MIGRNSLLRGGMSQQLPLVYRGCNRADFFSLCTLVFEIFEIAVVVSNVSAINACVGGLCLLKFSRKV